MAAHGAIDPAAAYAALLQRNAELEANDLALRQLGQQVQAQLAVAEQQLQQAAAAAAAVAAAVPAAAPPAAGQVQRPKIPSPPMFNGETGAAVDEWVDELEKQFVFYAAHFHWDIEKIRFALMYVSSKVALWYKSSAADRVLANRVVNTWAEFVAVFRERYQPISSSMAARAKLDRITQTGNVDNYTRYFFQNLAYIADMSPADQVHQYTRGLKPVIKLEVIKANHKRLSDAVNAAVQAEAYLGAGQSAAASGQSYRPHRNGGYGSAPMDLNAVEEFPAAGGYEVEEPATRESELFAMVHDLQAQVLSQQQVHAMFAKKDGDRRSKNGRGADSRKNGRSDKSDTRVPGVSKEDYERCRRDDLCIRCREPGHRAADCSKPVKTNW
jgi:hypothetical protein